MYIKDKDDHGNKNNEEEEALMIFQDPTNYDELRSIVASVTQNNPVSDVLFMGKYLVFLLENLVPWQKPIGDYFKSAFVICAAKQRKYSDQEIAETFCDTSGISPIGNPLLVQFEKLNLSCLSPERRNSLSVLQQLSLSYDIYPLSANLAKQIIFICSKLENDRKLPFMSICHGNRPGSLVLYGAGGQNNDFHLKLSTLGNVRALKNLPSILNIKTVHMDGLPLSMTSDSFLETLVSATYQFLGAQSDVGSNLVPVKDANLSVQCTWTVAETLLEPLPTECICFVKLQTIAGDDKSGAFKKYKEIKLLKALLHSFKSGSMTWTGTNTLDSILEEINELANEERKKIYTREYPELPDDADKLESAITEERMFLSVPDKLWIIIKNCSSFEDLIAAIQHTYKVFAELNITSLTDYGDAMSTISKDITSLSNRELLYKENYRKTIDQKRSAELLLEIGVEKLRRDYYEYFISNGLITQELFNQFTHPALLSLEAVTCLEKLHSVLELTLVCYKQLKLSRSILNEFSRNALKWLATSPEIDLQHIFTFQIPIFDIRPVLNTMRPVIWELSLKSEDKNFLKQSCHRFVTTATHDHIYAPYNYNPKLMLGKASYVYSAGTLIKENILASYFAG